MNDILIAEGMTIPEDKDINQIKDFPVGSYLVLLKCNRGELSWHVAWVRSNIVIIGHAFIFDLHDDLIAYKRLPDLNGTSD